MGLMAQVDILLDPIHFGSGNTLYEAMSVGTPIVTWPGRFMRGRIVAGAYRQMELKDPPIAEHLEDYAPLALALGKDAERRRAFRQAAVAAARSKLFADDHAVRELEAFLEQAVAAAGHDDKLPVDWNPGSAVRWPDQYRRLSAQGRLRAMVRTLYHCDRSGRTLLHGRESRVSTRRCHRYSCLRHIQPARISSAARKMRWIGSA